MARKNADAGENMEGSETAQDAAPAKKKAPPAGFRRRASVTDAPWFTLKEGNTCFGRLLGRYDMTNMDPPRSYYQVQLHQDAIVTVGKGDEAEETKIAAGEIVNVGETFRLVSLQEIEIPEILAGAEYDVWIDVGKKTKISGGRTMWHLDVQTKQIKKPTGQVHPLKVSRQAEGDDASGSPF